MKKWMILCTAVLTSITLTGCSDVAFAYTRNEAVTAIVGEASGEGGRDRVKKLQAMTMVAEAIRNRRSLKGVYGLTAGRKEPRWVWNLAEQAWENSAHTNLTKKATHWENVRAFGKPSWMKEMEITVTYLNHVFMRRKKC